MKVLAGTQDAKIAGNCFMTAGKMFTQCTVSVISASNILILNKILSWLYITCSFGFVFNIARI